MDYLHNPRGNNRSEFLGLSSFYRRRKLADLLMINKILTGKVPIGPITFFGHPLSRSRRGKTVLYVSVARTRIR